MGKGFGGRSSLAGFVNKNPAAAQQALLTTLDNSKAAVLNVDGPLATRCQSLDAIETVVLKIYDPFFKRQFKQRMVRELKEKFVTFRKGVNLSYSMRTPLDDSIEKELTSVVDLAKRGLTTGKWDGALYLSLFPGMEKVVGPWKG